jgi:hypothetical protein
MVKSFWPQIYSISNVDIPIVIAGRRQSAFLDVNGFFEYREAGYGTWPTDRGR